MQNSKNRLILVGIFVTLLVIGGGYYMYQNLFAAPGEVNDSFLSNEETNQEGVIGQITPPVENPEAEEGHALPIETEEEPIPEMPRPQSPAEDPETAEVFERFVVSLEANKESIAKALYEQGFVKSESALRSLLPNNILPGGYRLSKTMSAFQIADTFKKDPYMVWIVIPEGWRKEEIATRLAARLGWSDAVRKAWIDTHTSMRYDYVEGVYFPDTYLVPVTETPLDVANRFIAKFNEKLAPYLSEFASQNMKWTTGVTMASLVEREAAHDGEMALIAGILWNRLNNDMYLNVDATLQYARGDVGKGWWAPLSRAAGDLDIDSPYNTYTHKGLPPHPIANPGLAAIEAVLYPEETDCFYYLHDNDGELHCSVTYEEHQENIEKYLLE